ncbi:P-type conjugative transfer protein TrbL [Azohydromonas australica]|uniref:P-type conjugative transfer protein TrbL n=1 Tax=Azohydromonas australica TaxID=364039 RepID=UPI000420C0DD|nr:P-type conjugative transfer protein TrbL [Azohydromonas australica]
MKLTNSWRLALGLLLLALALSAQAQGLNSSGISDDLLERFRTGAAGWGGVIIKYASWVFWTLAFISLTVTFAFMALRRADFGEFFAELIRFLLTTGFFWWLLINAPVFSTAIITGLRRVAGEAAGLGSGALAPSGIVDIGFAIFYKAVDNSSAMKPVDSSVGIIAALGVLIVLGLIAINMLLLLASAWVLAYGGIFYLGFGGGRWTSDMAIHYYKMVLGVGMQLFAMVLVIGIGKSFIDDYYARMSAGQTLKELGVMLFVAVILFVLSNRLPALLAGPATGSHGGAAGIGNMGGGALVGAASMAMAASGMGLALAAAGTAQAAGGAQALMAAFKAAGDGGEGGSGEGGAGGSPGGIWSGGGDMGGGSGSAGGAEAGAPSAGGASTGSTPFAHAAGFDGGAPSFMDRMSATGNHLAQGAGQMAKSKLDEAKEAWNLRVAETPGGRLAAALKSQAQPATADGAAPDFEDDVLSGGGKPGTPEDEIAAFAARDPGTFDGEDQFDDNPRDNA